MAQGDDRRPPGRRWTDGRPCEDEEVRDFLLRANFAVDSELDARNFVEDMAFVRARRVFREQMRLGRTRFVIWFLGTIGVAAIGILVGVAAKWLNLPH